MTQASDPLELRFANCDYGLSARRLWEHTELGQINVFGHSLAINQRRETNEAAMFIDVVRFSGDTFSLVGLTLVELRADQILVNFPFRIEVFLNVHVGSHQGKKFIHSVKAHLDRCAIRQAVRNQHHPFLPTAHKDDDFGVPHIFSSLQHRLQGMGKSKAGGEQWLKTIQNFQGLRDEEFACSKLKPDLILSSYGNDQFTATYLADLCNFADLRISVIPVVSDAQRQLHFSKPNGQKLKRTKNFPKALAALPRTVAALDPVLGYRIEQVEHQTLWGVEHSGYSG